MALSVSVTDAGADVDANVYVGADGDEVLAAKTARLIVAPGWDYPVEFVTAIGSPPMWVLNWNYPTPAVLTHFDPKIYYLVHVAASLFGQLEIIDTLLHHFFHSIYTSTFVCNQ